MKILKYKFLMAGILVLSLAAILLSSVAFAAANDPCHPENNTPPGQALTPAELQSCQSCQDPTHPDACLNQSRIVADLNDIIKFLAGGIGLFVIGTIIIGGIQYSMAGDKAESVAKARQRMMNGLIALAAFLFIFAFLQWIVPGGVFHK